jgi:hypothetical protein
MLAHDGTKRVRRIVVDERTWLYVGETAMTASKCVEGFDTHLETDCEAAEIQFRCMLQ